MIPIICLYQITNCLQTGNEKLDYTDNKAQNTTYHLYHFKLLFHYGVDDFFEFVWRKRRDFFKNNLLYVNVTFQFLRILIEYIWQYILEFQVKGIIDARFSVVIYEHRKHWHHRFEFAVEEILQFFIKYFINLRGSSRTGKPVFDISERKQVIGYDFSQPFRQHFLAFRKNSLDVDK